MSVKSILMDSYSEYPRFLSVRGAHKKSVTLANYLVTMLAAYELFIFFPPQFPLGLFTGPILSLATNLLR